MALKDQTSQTLTTVDWPNSQAYAVGLNSLYLNQAGREGQGSLNKDQIKESLDQLKSQLLSWKGPDNKNVVSSALTNEEAFSGPFASMGPDLVIGYSPGFRASAETGTGNWADKSIEVNQDHWNADHCIDPQAVPGVIFSNRGLKSYPTPSYLDIPEMITGKTMKPGTPPDTDDFTEEDQETVEDRLKGLGYL